MSLVYWGIVAGLVLMVVTLFVSFALLGSKTGSSDASRQSLEEFKEHIERASSGRRAA
ncbi:MAG TPA: hypothetical protein PKA61_09895 [Nitrospira sp.]|nr:hypothetical protein [Nitrospira sp.]